MLNKRIAVLTLSIIFGLLSLSGCEQSTSSLQEPLNATDTFYYQTIEDDMEAVKVAGFPFDGSNAVFSIDWNNFPGRSMLPISAPLSGHVFAMAYPDIVDTSQVRQLMRIGQDMGTVILSYAENQIELNKIETPFGGIFYSNFEPMAIGRRGRMGQVHMMGDRPIRSRLQTIGLQGPGGNFTPVEFIADSDYTFEISGNESFTPFNISVTSPSELITITSHTFGSEIDTSANLRLTWAGASDGQVLIRLMAPRMMDPNATYDPQNRPESILFISQANTGEVTISKEDLQALTKNAMMPMLWIHISALQISELIQDDQTYHAIMRNGTQVLLQIKE
jgi:hypothetical protein